MKQITVEQPEAVRIEASPQAGFVEVVTVTNIAPFETENEDGETVTQYESDLYRLTYPEPESTDELQAYAESNFDIFAELAAAEENAGEPTQSADKLAALMVSNAALQETQDDLLIIVTDMIGGVE